MHAPVLGSIVVSSATSWMVLHLLLGDEPLFHVPAYQLVHPAEFGIYGLLGLAGGLVSVAFVKFLLWQRKQFLRMPARTEWLQPAAGGLTVGLLGWYVPGVLGVGYEYVSKALNGHMVIGTMALLVALKLIATTTCYASGNAGGIFGPSLFIGGMLGGAIGGAAHGMFPDYTGGVGAYALVGMGTAFAGIVRVPLTSVIMIFEVTRDYSIIVPLMISNLISYLVSSRLQREPIYEALQHQDGIYLPPGARDREEVLLVGAGIRPPTTALDGSQSVEETAAAMAGARQARPVLEGGLLLGMMTPERLDAALQAGRSHDSLSSFFPPFTTRPPLDPEEFPYIHRDEPLDLAMRRMAASGLNVLPVVSRANLRQLVGVISTHDIMAAYGLEEAEARGAAVAQETKAPPRILGGVLAALVLAVVLIAFLSYFYRAQRITRARESSRQGVELMQHDRYEEAIQDFRHALSISHSASDRLNLGMALVKAGHLDEAGIYLDEVLRTNPTNGPANLGLGRLYLAKGDPSRAVTYFRRAIDGSWPAKEHPDRTELRLELVRGLGKLGARRQAQSELLALLSDLPAGAQARIEIGRLLLEFGLSRQSAELLQETVQQARDSDEAYASLGEAELAEGDLPAAEEAFGNAIRLAPGNAQYGRRLDVVARAIALDPSIRGLGASERYTRSRNLLEAAVGSLDQCLSGGRTLTGADRDRLDAARKVLLRRSRPASYSDAADSSIGLAQRMWGLRADLCGETSSADEPVSRVMGRLSR